MARACEIQVRVIPRASRQGLEVDAQGVVKVRVCAPPVEGAANKAVVKLVAEAAGIRPRQVEIVSGHRGRTKRLRVEGMGLEELVERLKGGGSRRGDKGR